MASWDDLQQTSVDGVPVLWIPDDGQTQASLLFRVGRFDEPLPDAGISHFVEHMSFTLVGPRHYPYNGLVDGMYTKFVMATVDPANVAEFFASVCSALGRLDEGDVEADRRILLTEEGTRPIGQYAAILRARYGAVGAGAGGYPQYGLRRVGAAEIVRWARERFVAENAILFGTGRMPEDLSLQLPHGEWRPKGPPSSAVGSIPAFTVAQGGHVTLSGELPSGDGAGMTMALLNDRATDRLRRDEGISYGVSVDSVILPTGDSIILCRADGLESNLPAVAGGLLAIVDDLADTGPTEEEMDHVRRTLGEFSRSEGAVPAALERTAHRRLRGAPDSSPDELLHDVERFTEGDVRRDAERLRASMVMAGPVHFPTVKDRLPMRRLSVQPPIVAPPARPAPGYRASLSLTVGDDGAMQVFRDVTSIVRYSELAVTLRTTDGQLILFGNDGDDTAIDPLAWVDGQALVERALRAIPSEKVVNVEWAGPPSRKVPDRPPPPRPSSRWWTGLRRRPGALVLVLWGAASALLSSDQGSPVKGTLGAILATAGLVAFVVMAISLERAKAKRGIARRGSPRARPGR